MYTQLDHFCYDIIRAELQSITTVPVPDPAVWAFDDRNDTLFALDNQNDSAGPSITAEEWVRRGAANIQRELEKPAEIERVMSRKSIAHNGHGHGHGHGQDLDEGHAAAAQILAVDTVGGAAIDVTHD